MARTLLTADVSYYYNAVTGSNSNPGTAALPFADPVFAYQLAQRTLDLGGQYRVLVYNTGAYTNAVHTFRGPLFGAVGQESFVIDGGGQSNTISGAAGQYCFQAQEDAALTVTNAAVYPGVGGGAWLALDARIRVIGSWCMTNGANSFFDTCGSRAEIHASGCAVLQAGPNANNIAVAEDNSTIYLDGAWGIGATWNGVFAQADIGGCIDATGFSYAGGGGGGRMNSLSCGAVHTNGVGQTLFPGTVNGAVSANASLT